MNTITQILTDNGTVETLSLGAYAVKISAAIILGLIFSLIYQLKNSVSKSFAVTLAVLPAVVAVVIMMVNGSIGAGVAVAGAFSLVRFRSVPGSGRDILAVFIAMAIGLTCGLGTLLRALIFTAAVASVMLLLESIPFGELFRSSSRRSLRISIPEDLAYNNVFTDLFDRYTREYKLLSVKTTNLGSMLRLQYEIDLKETDEEQEFIDQLRIRNGNLEISSSIAVSANDEL